jgi:hypothetical protein
MGERHGVLVKQRDPANRRFTISESNDGAKTKHLNE